MAQQISFGLIVSVQISWCLKTKKQNFNILNVWHSICVAQIHPVTNHCHST